VAGNRFRLLLGVSDGVAAIDRWPGASDDVPGIVTSSSGWRQSGSVGAAALVLPIAAAQQVARAERARSAVGNDAELEKTSQRSFCHRDSFLNEW
jgi:hypothetical protein